MSEPIEPDAITDVEKKTILVAEDEAVLRLMISDMLEAENYQVLQAENGVQALRLVELHKELIDLVIADVLMPEMNGVELRNRISAIIPTTKILFISGYVREQTRHLVGLQQTDSFLPKPFTVETLVTKVREMTG